MSIDLVATVDRSIRCQQGDAFHRFMVEQVWYQCNNTDEWRKSVGLTTLGANSLQERHRMSAELMQVFDFTSEDLAANQQGRLSDQQRQRAAAGMRRTKITMVIAILVLATIAMYVLLPVVRTLSIEGNVGGLVGGGLLAGLALLLFTGLFEKPPSQFESAQGKAQFVQRESSVHQDDQVMFTTHNYVVIGEYDLSIKKEQYALFTEGHVYRAYYGQEPLGLLSIEYVGSSSGE